MGFSPTQSLIVIKKVPAYKMTAHELAMKMIRNVLATTGITATAGIPLEPHEHKSKVTKIFGFFLIF